MMRLVSFFFFFSYFNMNSITYKQKCIFNVSRSSLGRIFFVPILINKSDRIGYIFARIETNIIYRFSTVYSTFSIPQAVLLFVKCTPSGVDQLVWILDSILTKYLRSEMKCRGLKAWLELVWVVPDVTIFTARKSFFLRVACDIIVSVCISYTYIYIFVYFNVSQKTLYTLISSHNLKFRAQSRGINWKGKYKRK